MTEMNDLNDLNDLNDWDRRIIEEFRANGATLVVNSPASPSFY
jgi:hypothetical protein